MFKEDYDIQIVGLQVYGDSEDDRGRIALSTTGTYSERGAARFIAYKEYDEEDPRISHTAILKVEPDKVTMSRTGSGTRLILERGRRHLCLYDTGFGSMSVGIFTSELESTLSPAGGRLNVKYTLDIDSALSSSNELEVEIRPRGKRRLAP